MLHFQDLVRIKPVAILSGQAPPPHQNFGPPVRFGLLRLHLYFITNDTLLKTVHGQDAALMSNTPSLVYK